MPIIRHWFDTPQQFEWEIMESSFFEDISGPKFAAYPLYWLLPYVYLEESDLQDAPNPVWITEIHPSSSLGVINDKAEGSFIIDLPSTFGEYIDSLQSSHRKKYRAVLRKNEDLTFESGTQGDIDALWSQYTSRLSILTARESADSYTEAELHTRRDFYRSKNISILNIKHGSELLAVNVSLWKDGNVYDLACLIDSNLQTSHRSLGSLAILKNIALAVSKGMTSYDLLTRDYGYKRSYGAREVKVKQYVKADESFKKAYNIVYP